MSKAELVNSEQLLEAILKTPRDHRPALTQSELEILKAHSLKVFGSLPPHGIDDQTRRTAKRSN
jgi:hypothetical protein